MERNQQQYGPEVLNDMDLLFGRCTNDVERGAHAYGAEESFDLFNQSSAGFGKNREVQESKFLRRDFDFSPIPELDDLAFAVRYVLFDKSMQKEVFDHIVNFVRNFQADAPNFEMFPEEGKIIGCLFEESQFASYCLQLFHNTDTLGLSCDLTNGFAPALNPFWNSLRQALIDAQFVSQEDETFEDEEDDDFDFLDSDTEDDGFVLDLSIPSMKYLNLEEDQTVIENWVQDIQDPNFSQETLLSLSYNCQSETNLQLLAGNYAQQLFDSIIASFSSTTAETLPSVRSACVFLAELSKFSNVNVTEGSIKVLIDQLAKWTLSQKKNSEVMRSEEVATLLSKCILPKFSELVSGVLKNIQTDVLETIQNETDFDEVKYYVDQYRQNYAQAVR